MARLAVLSYVGQHVVMNVFHSLLHTTDASCKAAILTKQPLTQVENVSGHPVERCLIREASRIAGAMSEAEARGKYRGPNRENFDKWHNRTEFRDARATNQWSRQKDIDLTSFRAACKKFDAEWSEKLDNTAPQKRKYQNVSFEVFSTSLSLSS
jgi:hypothetical protein